MIIYIIHIFIHLFNNLLIHFFLGGGGYPLPVLQKRDMTLDWGCNCQETYSVLIKLLLVLPSQRQVLTNSYTERLHGSKISKFRPWYCHSDRFITLGRLLSFKIWIRNISFKYYQCQTLSACRNWQVLRGVGRYCIEDICINWTTCLAPRSSRILTKYRLE